MASPAQALDLGALHVYSEAGQPLDAEIQLLDVEGLSADEIRPRFAGVDDLALSGLDNKRYLSGVRFFVAIEKDKSATLRLVSDQPINQSFLSFLLEVNWPQGRLLREYTALLKGEVKSTPVAASNLKALESVVVETASAVAPVYVPQGEQVAASPVPEEKPVLQAMQSAPVGAERPLALAERKPVKPVVQDVVPEAVVDTPSLDAQAEDHSTDVVEHSHPIEMTKPVLVRDSERVYVNEETPEEIVTAVMQPLADKETQLSQKAAKPATVAPASDNSPSVASGAVVVSSKQTLWDIANRHRPQGDFSNQQMMLALYEKNPQAFVSGDINRIKGHAVLSLPTVAELERYDRSAALGEVRQKLNESSEMASRDIGVASRTPEVVVGPKETLWDIAVKYRTGPEVNTRQMMLAIVKSNPHAFVDGNINRMLKGVVLTMPTAKDLRQWSKEDASAEVRRQISDWQAGGVSESPAAAKSDSLGSTKRLPESVTTVAKVKLQASGAAEGPKRLVVGKKETLWTIALNHLPDASVTAGQMIKAIIKKNPHAFVNGNMNEMRVGEVLEMPTLAEIRELNGS
ncbi:FimV/HubP family polar landmark protein [Pontibacterium granulatum]|uniref:FimV/HubP family polar landmark protein n=1 Tax=Pontibacterium granulatum TaxID=2036029 RepID=UPI00249A8940|nr:FimV/HubP family polar landmark protein [Pontibacterium granulatum]MDI3325001.1 FimV/HubP family polar landmark protein [Pontibacterium granulatum]